METKQFENIVGTPRILATEINGLKGIDIEYVNKLEHQYEVLFNMLYEILIIHVNEIPMRFQGEHQDFYDIQHKRFEDYKDKNK